MNLKSKMLSLLEKEPTEKNVETLKKLGFNDDEIDNCAMLVASVYEKALKGNASALKFIAYFLADDKEEETENTSLKELFKDFYLIPKNYDSKHGCRID